MKSSDIDTTCDYTERLYFKLYKYIMSLKFDNSFSLLIEGTNVKYYEKDKIKKDKITAYKFNKKIPFNVKKYSLMDFHSQLSDSSIKIQMK